MSVDSKTLATPTDTPHDPGAVPTRPSGDSPIASLAPPPDTGSLTDDDHRYLERGLLGHGGMGEVHCFHDRRIGRDVARKVLLGELSNDAAARRRFVREARIQGQIEHPAVVPVYDLEVEPNGAVSFTMKRVSGRTLREILASMGDPATRARFSRRKLLTGLANICLALDSAHARGIVHRDLKPANLMFGELGEVYVLDWGVARAPGDLPTVADPSGAPISQTGIVGTPWYMAPEQVTGVADARSDVYAMGVVLFEVLAGKPLRTSMSPLHVLRDVEVQDPRPSLHDPDVPPELDAICARAAAKNPADRYPSTRALAEAIEAYLDGDRDLERRRAVARERAEAANKLAEAGDHDGATAEVMRALAFDPENADARAVLQHLLLDAPERLSPAAEEELKRERDARRARDLRNAAYGWALMMIPMPFTVLLGGVRWVPTLIAFTLIAGMSALSYRNSRRPSLSRAEVIVYIAMAGLATMMSSLWLGPFIMLPVSGAMVTTLVVLGCTREERPWALAIGTIAVALPMLADVLGLVQRSTFLEPGRVILVSRFAQVNPTWTLVGLTWTSAAFAPFAGWVAGRIRDTLTEAERRLFAHAWHLRRIAPNPPAAPR